MKVSVKWPSLVPLPAPWFRLYLLNAKILVSAVGEKSVQLVIWDCPVQSNGWIGFHLVILAKPIWHPLLHFDSVNVFYPFLCIEISTNPPVPPLIFFMELFIAQILAYSFRRFASFLLSQTCSTDSLLLDGFSWSINITTIEWTSPVLKFSWAMNCVI